MPCKYLKSGYYSDVAAASAFRGELREVPAATSRLCAWRPTSTPNPGDPDEPRPEPAAPTAPTTARLDITTDLRLPPLAHPQTKERQ